MTGEHLRECRNRLRLTVQHLADVLSNEDRTVDSRLVRRWEAGQRPVPPEVAAWLEAAAAVPAPAGFWFERPPGP